MTVPIGDLHRDAFGDDLHVPFYLQSADPGAVGAGKLWCDNSDGDENCLYKQRNAGDTDWLVLFGIGTNAGSGGAYVLAAEKGAADGVATLGSDGKIPGAQLPALAIGEVFTVASQAAMLALTAQRGDVAVRTDIGKTYILSSDTPGTLADWVEMLAAGAVPDGSITTAKLATDAKSFLLVLEFGDGLTVPTVNGIVGGFRIPFPFTITRGDIATGDGTTGSAVIDVLTATDPAAGAAPSYASIVGGAGTKPTLSSAGSNLNFSLTGYTVSFAGGTWITGKLVSSDTKKPVVTLTCVRS